MISSDFKKIVVSLQALHNGKFLTDEWKRYIADEWLIEKFDSIWRQVDEKRQSIDNSDRVVQDADCCLQISWCYWMK